jgi:NADPH:quinone reductase-like Zn-dependent oxidoreductase
MEVAMLAIRVHRFGTVDTLVSDDVPQPVPGAGEVLLRVKAAGVGPWDAWIRAGRSVLPQPLPLTLGSDVAGVVEAVGHGVTGFARGDAVFGATNTQFTGGYAEYAVATAGMLARMPSTMSFVEAASVPVIGCTAWQMVFEHGAVDATTRVLVLGGGGNVGAYAVQLAKRVARRVVATSSAADADYVRTLGADDVVDPRATKLANAVSQVDVVLDTLGGAPQEDSFDVLRAGGALVSVVSAPDRRHAERRGVRAFFFLVDVSSRRLGELSALITSGALRTRIGEVLPLRKARVAHEMLDGRPHKRGKIVLTVDDGA